MTRKTERFVKYEDKEFLPGDFMIKFLTLFFLAASFLLLSSCSGANANNRNSELDAVRSDKEESPCDGRWASIFFPELEDALSKTSLKMLSTIRRDSDVTEVRVWVGFNNTTLKGYVLSKSTSKASAYYVSQDLKKGELLTKVAEKKLDVRAVLKHLEGLGLLTMYDGCSNDDSNRQAEDSKVIIIETLDSGKYRAIIYPDSTNFQTVQANTVFAMLRYLENIFEHRELGQTQ